MCDTCGCGDPEVVPVELNREILGANNERARHNREHFAGKGIFAVNLMGSPGSGKTAVLETTAREAGGKWRLLAISGDLATNNDAMRLRAAGIPARTITTGSACHLDARLIHDALHEMDLPDPDLLFIENVGNLVCPAIYDLGQSVRVVALSVTEGDDKPLKYPVIFRDADLVLLTKTDLLPHLPDSSIEQIRENLSRVMPGAESIALSTVSGEGFSEWIGWLEKRRALIPGAPAVHPV